MSNFPKTRLVIKELNFLAYHTCEHHLTKQALAELDAMEKRIDELEKIINEKVVNAGIMAETSYEKSRTIMNMREALDAKRKIINELEAENERLRRCVNVNQIGENYEKGCELNEVLPKMPL